jgi:hypothetical protein
VHRFQINITISELLQKDSNWKLSKPSIYSDIHSFISSLDFTRLNTECVVLLKKGNYSGGLSALLGITLKSPQISLFFSKK